MSALRLGPEVAVPGLILLATDGPAPVCVDGMCGPVLDVADTAEPAPAD